MNKKPVSQSFTGFKTPTQVKPVKPSFTGGETIILQIYRFLQRRFHKFHRFHPQKGKVWKKKFKPSKNLKSHLLKDSKLIVIQGCIDCKPEYFQKALAYLNIYINEVYPVNFRGKRSIDQTIHFFFDDDVDYKCYRYMNKYYCHIRIY